MRRAAPAKTNLFLEVPRRREDGFHELDTVFVALELADHLMFDMLAGGKLELEILGDAELSAGPDNLVLKAAEALRGAARMPQLGARVLLAKAIPAGGGLGGGSADAAATLLGLNALWDLRVREEKLLQLAAGLGSDVAFFLRAGLQRGQGRGELLSPLPAPARELDLVLVFPGFPCPTPQVYGALAPFLPERPRDPAALLEALGRGDLPAVGQALFNRLEAPAFQLYPRLAELKQDLVARPGVLGALLSGSGSTLLALTADAEAAATLAGALTSEGLRAVATRTAACVPAP